MFGYSNSIVKADLQQLFVTALPWNKLNNSTILVTGANGMIATYIIYFLMYLNIEKKNNVKVIALSRNKAKAKELFSEFWADQKFTFLEQDVCEEIKISTSVDYIFHFAGNASPFYIKTDPVGIMKSNLIGTFNVLDFAKDHNVKKVLFASTREVYGENTLESRLTEQSFGHIDCLDARSCYPESKRSAETLCMSYFLQYGVKFNTVRIAHTYGPGMKINNDGRVMADLISCAVQGKNILLKSTGEALRAFCYVTDTLSGLFYILFKGNNAEAYNLANETEEVSIRNLAEIIISRLPDKKLQIVYDIPEEQSSTYCNYKRVGLDVTKLEGLGWKPNIKLEVGLRNTILSFEK